ncbi:oligosaccharide flippase family protein [Halobacillus sp. A1]|uniref:lipopolysaccharide biosynthesis protein n=1 Tax=Halobacillus sp. A1 TaxID=2880262 RepID=UPI0020A690BB|nr:oligosaccharide flippase family protein [Halobacillus sp. A1]MCP3032937.1 oligosaccharide flippase family protein [Halobacillus sp. A1]
MILRLFCRKALSYRVIFIILKKINQSRIGKSIFLVAGGTVFAQLIHLIFTPIITRVYSPDEFGVLTTYTTILGLLSLVAFKYEIAIPIAKSNKIAINILALSIIILSVYVAAISFILFYMGDWLLKFFSSETIVNYWYAIPVGIFLLGLYKILYSWASREKDFSSISKTAVGQSLAGNLFKIFTGIMGAGGLGLILGNVIGQSAGTLTLSRTLLRKNNLLKNVNGRRMRWCINRYKDFPIYNLPTHIISTLGEKAPVLFFTSFYGTQVVGLYGLAYMIVRLPMSLIGKAVGDVFYAEAASEGRKNPKKLKILSNKILFKLALVGLIPLIVLLLFGPFLFSFVFGDKWSESGEYARIISVSLFFILVFAPVSRVYEVFEKQRLRFSIDIIRLILILIAFSVTALFDLNSYTSILLYTIVISFIHILIFILGQKIMNEEIKKWNFR